MGEEGRRAADGREREVGLDPDDWEAMRALGHRMVDDVIAFHRAAREEPAWRPVPDEVKAALADELPAEGVGDEAVYTDFLGLVRPYTYGNFHPRGWGWVNGAGSTLGAFAEMWAAALNPNCWGAEQGAAYAEMQVLRWAREWMGFPADAGAVLVSGASMASLVGLAAARARAGAGGASARGLRELPAQMTVYTSTEAHNTIERALGLLGLGWDHLRRVPVDAEHRMDVAALSRALQADRAAGRLPACVVATAGTVNTGAIDPLPELADFCAREGVWLHVDAAYGAALALSPGLRGRIAGIERADSVAFDYHKWLQVPIDAACALVRDPRWHREPFSPPAAYLAHFDRGIASGPATFSDLSPELTRPFRALKVWMMLRAHGSARFGRIVEQGVRHARLLARMVEDAPDLELTAPVPLCIVCFRYVADGMRGDELDALNRELLLRLQESGEAIVSSTVLGGVFTLRAALTNHRTREDDLRVLVDAVRRIGGELAGG